MELVLLLKFVSPPLPFTKYTLTGVEPLVWPGFSVTVNATLIPPFCMIALGVITLIFAQLRRFILQFFPVLPILLWLLMIMQEQARE